MMLLLSIVTVSIAVVYAQDPNLKSEIDALFGNASSRDPFNNLVLVTTPEPSGFGALTKCGEGDDEGAHACVPYHQCDGVTKLIIMDGSTTGFGQIDIRFGENSCEHFLDVCCGIPAGTRGPDGEVSVEPPRSSDRPPVSSVSPPVSSDIPPVSSVSPPVSSVSPPVTQATPRPSSAFCGIRNPNGIDFKITGNKDNEAEYGEFPWMVALLLKNFNPARDKTLSFCGGSLIAPNVVLTGAHCVVGRQADQFKVRAGEWDTQTEKERLPYQERDVSQVIIHDGYVPGVVYNNVALLILRSPFEQADNIGTICLPNQDEVITSRNCFASGWGKDVFGKEGKYQVILKKIEVPMVDHGTCQRALRTTRLGQLFNLHKSFICAGGELGKDTCTGDGGSPLICPDPRNPSRYVQSGIVSWGIGCGEKNIPGVYANVVKFRNWIDNQLSRLNINTNPYTV